MINSTIRSFSILLVGLLLMIGNQAFAQSSSEIENELKAKYFKNATIVIQSDNGAMVYKSFEKLSDEHKSMIPLPPPPPPVQSDSADSNNGEMISLPPGTVVEYDPKSNALRISSNGDNVAPPPPPVHPKAPNAPKVNAPSDVDIAVDIAKEGGTFSIDGEMVSSDQAIAVLKKPDSIKTIDTKGQPDGKRMMIITTKK